MIAGGEDGIFIARRMVIFASEDVGMADPNALLVASAVFRAVETVGLPEAGINLAHGTVYMATAPKHRAAYDGLYAALAEVESTGNLAIPLFLRNAPTRLMQELGYARSQTDGESRLPEGVQARKFYNP
jgi:putative ATPase